MEKSITHTRVRKNGIDCWMSKHVIQKLSEEKVRKNGWEILNDIPEEVIELKRKNIERIENPIGETEHIEIKSTKDSVVTEQIVEKRKYTKKK